MRSAPDPVSRLVIDFDSKHRSHLEGLLQPGETIKGICAATRQQGPFKGGAVAVGVSDRRLLIQPLDRRGESASTVTQPPPAPLAFHRVDLMRLDGDRLAGYAIADHVAVRLKLKTTSGEKLNLMLMGRGPGGRQARRQ